MGLAPTTAGGSMAIGHGGCSGCMRVENVVMLHGFEVEVRGHSDVCMWS